MGFLDLFRGKDDSPSEQLINVYKGKGYKRIPVLPNNDNEILKILNTYEAFPAALVPKDYMEVVDKTNTLIWGNIVMLWWLDNVNRKNIPDYFIYQYGIDFNTELLHLKNKDLIDDNNKLTFKGKEILSHNEDIIKKHKAKKIFQPNGKIEYKFEGAEETKNITEFISDGDFLEDQRLGSSFEKNKDYKNAEKAYLSAIENGKADKDMQVGPPNAYYRLAIIYRKLGEFDKEIKILEKGIKDTNYKQATTTNNKLKDRLDKLMKK